MVLRFVFIALLFESKLQSNANNTVDGNFGIKFPFFFHHLMQIFFHRGYRRQNIFKLLKIAISFSIFCKIGSSFRKLHLEFCDLMPATKRNQEGQRQYYKILKK